MSNFRIVFDHAQRDIYIVDNTYVRSVLNNYKQILISIEDSRSEICEDIEYLKEKCTAEQTVAIGSKRIEDTPTSRTNTVSDPVCKSAERIEHYRNRIYAQMANLAYYDEVEDRVRGIRNIYTKMSLIFPLHYRIVYETFVCHRPQDEVRLKLRYAKMTIKTMQDNLVQIITDVSNMHKPIEDINRMPPDVLMKEIKQLNVEIYNKMRKIEEESEKNDNWN